MNERSTNDERGQQPGSLIQTAKPTPIVLRNNSVCSVCSVVKNPSPCVSGSPDSQVPANHADERGSDRTDLHRIFARETDGIHKTGSCRKGAQGAQRRATTEHAKYTETIHADRTTIRNALPSIDGGSPFWKLACSRRCNPATVKMPDSPLVPADHADEGG
jgi:hypothetical protein